MEKYPDRSYHTPKLLPEGPPTDAFLSPSKRHRTTTFTDFIAKCKKTEKRRKQRKITRQHQNRYGK
jgi:hypothetical protein